ncbi:MAG: chemotaxis response regulator protein-glutamate methylesterase [Candidatus Gastranaerophilales bacterium]|nr:chemotaxis response regulator protein-glutamate methylesterase [Candidatus Gastranaerophilales bacterium]
MAKKILIVDDSALMRRVLCDIIDSDVRFQVVDRAANGLEAFDLISRNNYDAVVLDVNMPKMNGLELLRKLRQYKISVRVVMASTATQEGAKITMDALELGALDFIHKPDNAADCRVDTFKSGLLRMLAMAVESNLPTFDVAAPKTPGPLDRHSADNVTRSTLKVPGRKLVAIASSTGGPKSLQAVIPKLPANLDAPVLLVQHMPKGFTASLSERLNDLSEVTVREVAEGMELEKGTVYVAMGGKHMNVKSSASGKYTIHLSDEPNREGVKPCANYMYESLMDSNFDNIVCVVMTGMGADGTEGIRNLKSKKKVHVISQDQATSIVYGMPKSIALAGLSDQVVPLDKLAQEIISHVGVQSR